jgi:hypothetical protein
MVLADKGVREASKKRGEPCYVTLLTLAHIEFRSVDPYHIFSNRSLIRLGSVHLPLYFELPLQILETVVQGSYTVIQDRFLTEHALAKWTHWRSGGGYKSCMFMWYGINGREANIYNGVPWIITRLSSILSLAKSFWSTRPAALDDFQVGEISELWCSGSSGRGLSK